MKQHTDEKSVPHPSHPCSISSFFHHPTSHFTKKLRRYTNVGGDLLLREASDQCWIFFAKQFKTLFGAEAHVIEQALLVVHQCVFGKDTEEAFKLGDIPVQLLLSGFGEQKRLCFFQRLDVQCTRFLADQAVQISDPPVGRRKIQHMLIPIFVGGITPQTTFRDKNGVPTNIAFPQYYLPRLVRGRFQHAEKMLLLLRFEVNVAGDVLKYKSVVQGMRNKESGMAQVQDFNAERMTSHFGLSLSDSNATIAAS